MVLDPFPIKIIIFPLKMGFGEFQWVERVGGIILGVVFGIEHKHKSLWRRSPPGVCFQEKHVPVFLGPVLGKIEKMKENTSNDIPIPIKIPLK